MVDANQSEVMETAIIMPYQGVWIRFISLLIDPTSRINS